MSTLPGLIDVTSDLQIKTPQTTVVIDRDRASAVGVTADQIEYGLYDAYAQRWISTIYAPTNQYKVLIEALPQYQADPRLISLLYIRSSSGKLIPLDTLAYLKPTVGPQTINHYGQLPAVTMSFNLKQGVSLGDAVNDIGDLSRRILPGTISTNFQGTAQAFQQSTKSLWLLLVLALLVVYIVLGILYEIRASPHHPVRAAVGGVRRAADPVAVQARPEPVFLHRPGAVDRHCEEERDYANRLRAGC